MHFKKKNGGEIMKDNDIKWYSGKYDKALAWLLENTSTITSSGSTTNLLSSGGQDLELFKKTKDRGFIKFLQIAMFVVSLTLIICGFIAMMINKK